MAINIMKRDALGELQSVVSVLSECKNLPEEMNTEIQHLKVASNKLANEAEFIHKINNGLQYYDDDLWEAAAKTWYDAMNSIPQFYVDNGVIDMTGVMKAKADFENQNYLRSADLYKNAYRRVVAR
jgi:hypothetical protein